jgi:hypothetical protein
MALAGGTASAGDQSSSAASRPATAIDLGAQTDVAAATLELSDAELDTISAAILTSAASATSREQPDHRQAGHYSLLSLTCSGAVIDGTASEQADIASPNSRCSPRAASAQRTTSILRRAADLLQQPGCREYQQHRAADARLQPEYRDTTTSAPPAR